MHKYQQSRYKIQIFYIVLHITKTQIFYLLKCHFTFKILLYSDHITSVI